MEAADVIAKSIQHLELIVALSGLGIAIILFAIMLALLKK